MKILVITNTLLKGGAEKQAVKMSNILALKNDVYLLVVDGRKIENEYINSLSSKVSVLFCQGNVLQRLFDILRTLSRHHFEASFSFLAQGNLFNGIFGKFFNIPIRYGGLRTSYVEGIKLTLQRINHNYFLTGSVANSFAGAKFFIENGFNAKKIQILYNYLDAVPTVTTRRRSTSETFNVISVGRFVALKDHYMLIDATKTLVELGYKIEIKIVGYGEDKQILENYIHKLGLENIVELIINPLGVLDYYLSAHVFVSCSRFEGVSNSLIEAMSCGLPAIVTKVGDNELILQDSRFTINVQDVGALVKSIIFLIENEDERVMAGQLNSKRVFNLFNNDNYIKNLERLIKIES